MRRATLSALYFFAYGPSGLIFPFIPLILSARGLTPTTISIVLASNPLLNLFVPPLWASFADAFHARVALLRITLFGCALTVLLLFPDLGFGAAILAMSVFCFFRTPIPSLLDSATVAELSGKTEGFARIRAWGSLSFAFGAGLAALLDRSGRAELVIVFAAAMYAASGLISLRLDTPPLVREPAVFKKTLAYVKSAGLVPIFVASGLYYAAHSVYDVHFALFMDQLDDRDLVGPSWMLGVLCEVGVMFASPVLLRSRAPKNVLVFASSVATLRWAIMSLLPGRPILFGIQAVHGITFGMWYLSLVKEAQESAPEELRSSVQAALLTAMGSGTVAGYVLGGLILESWGGAWMWRIAALTTAVSAVLYSVVALRAPKR